MTLLRSLPDVYYNINPSFANPEILAAKNLWRRGQILDEYKTSISIFDEYIVKNGETPEIIANELYENPFYNWTLLVVNDIVNYHDQWPRSSASLNEYVFSKYSNPLATKHHVTTEVLDANGNVLLPAGKIVPSTYTLSYTDINGFQVTVAPVTPVTYYQYEEELNAEKEKIQLIRPALIEGFVDAYYRKLVQGGDLQIGLSTDKITM